MTARDTAPATATEAVPVAAPDPAPDRVLQGGRAKAYRPLPVAERAAALQAGLEAWDRGDFFLAHELLEPAWMGASDPVERDVYQGLIKLSAGYVHAVRGNPAGVVANLRGAHDRLASAVMGGSHGATSPVADAGLDLAMLLADVDDRLATAESIAASSPLRGPRRGGEPARQPVSIDPPRLVRPSR